MTKEKDFYPARSEAISALIKVIELSDALGRNLEDELNEILWEVQEEYGVKRDDILQIN